MLVQVTKRCIDLLGAFLGICLLTPFFMYLALRIRAESPGPVFFRGVRVGKGGRRFRIFKFRTMVPDAERRGGPSTPEDDPRVTSFGRFLRRYKLDELPQLLNVLRGEMSLVGPRPEVPIYADMLAGEERAILNVKPGITDWASIWNPNEGALLAGEADPERAYLERIRPTKIKLQLHYVRQASLATDIKILYGTMATLISSDGKGL